MNMVGKTDKIDDTAIINNLSENKDLLNCSNRNILKVPKNKTKSMTVAMAFILCIRFPLFNSLIRNFIKLKTLSIIIISIGCLPLKLLMHKFIPHRTATRSPTNS
jgi:hypothetical protein